MKIFDVMATQKNAFSVMLNFLVITKDLMNLIAIVFFYYENLPFLLIKLRNIQD